MQLLQAHEHGGRARQNGALTGSTATRAPGSARLGAALGTDTAHAHRVLVPRTKETARPALTCVCEQPAPAPHLTERAALGAGASGRAAGLGPGPHRLPALP